MIRGGSEGLELGAVSLGWVVTILCGSVFGGVSGLITGAVGGSLGLLTTATAIGTLLSGFLAHVVGGFCAARSARTSGRLNGAMIAVLGLVVGLVPTITFAVFGGISGAGLAMPQVSFGAAAGSLLAAAFLFLFNLLGGYIGGGLGERSTVGHQTRDRSTG